MKKIIAIILAAIIVTGCAGFSGNRKGNVRVVRVSEKKEKDVISVTIKLTIDRSEKDD